VSKADEPIFKDHLASNHHSLSIMTVAVDALHHVWVFAQCICRQPRKCEKNGFTISMLCRIAYFSVYIKIELTINYTS